MSTYWLFLDQRAWEKLIFGYSPNSHLRFVQCRSIFSTPSRPCSVASHKKPQVKRLPLSAHNGLSFELGSYSRLAAVPSESVLPPPRDPISLGEPTDQPLKSNTIPRATGLVRSSPQLVEKLSPPTPVNDGKPSSPFENFPIRESHLLANQAARRDVLAITLPYELEIHIALANAENNIKNEGLEQGVGETIGVVEHPGIEGPELAEQAHASNKDFRIEKNLRDKKRDSAPEMDWALEEPEEEEGEQAAAQMEVRAKYMPGESRPHCVDDGTPRNDRPAEGNNAHDGAYDKFEAEE